MRKVSQERLTPKKRKKNLYEAWMGLSPSSLERERDVMIGS